jgi:hypothetical protein
LEGDEIGFSSSSGTGRHDDAYIAAGMAIYNTTAEIAQTMWLVLQNTQYCHVFIVKLM